MPVSRRRSEISSHESHSPRDDDSGSVENSSESASGEEEEEEFAESSTLQAKSGITYDLTGLDFDSEAKAVVGLTGEFDVVDCVAADSGYDFQLSEQPRVHIGVDRDTCSCSAFQRQPSAACQHVFVSPLYAMRISSDVPSGFLINSSAACLNALPTMCPCRALVVRRTFHLSNSSWMPIWNQ